VLCCRAQRYLQLFYRCSARELRRLESTALSPLYGLFGEVVGGAATIRGAGAQRSFVKVTAMFADSKICLLLLTYQHLLSLTHQHLLSLTHQHLLLLTHQHLLLLTHQHLLLLTHQHLLLLTHQQLVISAVVWNCCSA
jgi:hypothetical protein